MLCTLNWIERLNRSYKRTLHMRAAMPLPEAVLFLLGAVALQMTTETIPQRGADRETERCSDHRSRQHRRERRFSFQE